MHGCRGAIVGGVDFVREALEGRKAWGKIQILSLLSIEGSRGSEKGSINGKGKIIPKETSHRGSPMARALKMISRLPLPNNLNLLAAGK